MSVMTDFIPVLAARQACIANVALASSQCCKCCEELPSFFTQEQVSDDLIGWCQIGCLYDDLLLNCSDYFPTMNLTNPTLEYNFCVIGNELLSKEPITNSSFASATCSSDGSLNVSIAESSPTMSPTMSPTLEGSVSGSGLSPEENLSRMLVFGAAILFISSALIMLITVCLCFGKKCKNTTKNNVNTKDDPEKQYYTYASAPELVSGPVTVSHSPEKSNNNQSAETHLGKKEVNIDDEI